MTAETRVRGKWDRAPHAGAGNRFRGDQRGFAIERSACVRIATIGRLAGFLPMKISTLRLQFRSLEDNLLTTQVNIGRLECLVAGLSENDDDRLEVERQLMHLRYIQSALEEIRSGLIAKFESFRPAATQGSIPGIAH